LRENDIDDRFRKERRLLERTGLSDFAKDKIYQPGCLKNAAYEKLYSLNLILLTWRIWFSSE
jgi:hypothetical protein